MEKKIYLDKRTGEQLVLSKPHTCAEYCTICALYIKQCGTCRHEDVATSCIKTVFGRKMYFHFKKT